MRVVTYARVSTAQQAEAGSSLEEQRLALVAACVARGWEHVEHIEDAGISGSLLDRPGVERLTLLASTRAMDLVLCAKVDRLARKAWIAEHLIDRLAKHGVAVEFTEQSFDAGPVGDLTRGLIAHIAQFERALIRGRTMKGKREKAQSGRWPAGLQMMGYRVIQRWQEQADPQYAGRSGEIEADPDTAPVITELFRRYDAGESAYGAARWLRESGLRGPKGGTWSTSTVRRLLACEAYATGRLAYGRQEWRLQDERGKGGGRSFRVQDRAEPEWEWVACPVLVERAVWERVQTRLQSAAEASKGRPTSVYPLRGCIYCAKCKTETGQPRLLYGYRGNSNPTRPGYHKLRYRCINCLRSLDSDRVRRLVWADIDEKLKPELFLAGARAAYAQQQLQTGDVRAEVERLRAEVQRVETKQERLLDLSEDYTAEMLRAQSRKLRTERETLAADLRALEARAVPVVALADLEAQALNLHSSFAALAELARDDPEAEGVLFRRIVRVTAYTWGKVGIRLSFG